jgi:lipopolysaccharide biosynthesis glycosyltransferase
MPSRCICYTTDPGYLLPTLVSARQAREHAHPGKTDVAIFSIGGTAEINSVFGRICDQEGILFLAVKEQDVEGAGAMLARLFLDRLAPPDYDQLLYIDGDTQITGSLDPLLNAVIPARHFLAVTDPMSFSLGGAGRHDRDLAEYFTGIGILPAQQKNYFNSGVLFINRDGWEETGRDSWKLFQKLRGHSRFPDQDALNLVAMDRRIPISLAWNFPIFLRNADVESIIQPRILHYMGSPKPWHGSFLPWSEAQVEPYIQLMLRYPELAPYATHMKTHRRLKYKFQQRGKAAGARLFWIMRAT